nr:hypothetical protein [uncultured Sellimonas sp.]
MAYRAKRSKRFTEEFELEDENGNVVKTLQVSLDADDMVAKLNRKYTALVKALNDTTELKRQTENAEIVEGCVETLGRAVVDMLEAVFGAEDAKVIVDFYEGRYLEMCKEVLPFITQCVIPRCNEIKKENQKSILQSYNRKQRRALFRKV